MSTATSRAYAVCIECVNYQKLRILLIATKVGSFCQLAENCFRTLKIGQTKIVLPYPDHNETSTRQWRNQKIYFGEALAHGEWRSTSL